MYGKQNFKDIHPRAGLAKVSDKCSKCPLDCGFQIKPIIDDDCKAGSGLDPDQHEAETEGVFGDPDPPRVIFRRPEVNSRQARPKPWVEDLRQTEEFSSNMYDI